MHASQATVPLLALAAVTLFGCKDSASKDGVSKDDTSKEGVSKEGVSKDDTPDTQIPASPPTVSAADAAPKGPALVRSRPLPKVASMALRERMLNHGDDTENLLWSTLMLDYESTDGIAGRISETPTLARPGPGELDTINAMLPAEFFELQDQLNTSVRALRTAARAKDDSAMAVQYGQVVQTCIQCHSLYLQFPTAE